MKANSAAAFTKAFDRITQSHYIQEAVVLIEDSQGNYSWSRGYGGRDIDSPLLMASIGKLFTTTCILALQERGQLSLNDRLAMYIDDQMLSGLHVYKGREYTSELTVSDLLFQASGLPDIFEESKNATKARAIQQDFSYDLDDMIRWTKQLKPRFAPGTKGKAHYADINFDLLGAVIEKVNGTTIADAYEEFIYRPLKLTSTYLPLSVDDHIPSICYKEQRLNLPLFVCSCRASGGTITTARELMIFLKAFFGGKLFNSAVMHTLAQYNRLQLTMGPIRYGGGYMRIGLQTLLTAFRGSGELLGHSGTSGSFAFYYPKNEIFFVGDLNQLAKPSWPIRFVMQLAMKA